MTGPSAFPPPAIDVPEDFAPAVRRAVATAIADGTRTLTALDLAFGDIWPWDDAAMLSSLSGWLRLPQRRMVLLAARNDTMERRFPRFVQWRLDWIHAVAACEAPVELSSVLPSALFGNRRMIAARLEATQGLGRTSLEPRAPLLGHDKTDAVLQRSTPWIAAWTLGF